MSQRSFKTPLSRLTPRHLPYEGRQGDGDKRSEFFEFSEKTLDKTSSAMIGYGYRCKNDSCFCEKRNDAHVQSPGRNVRTCCRALKTVQVDTFRPGHSCFGAFLFEKSGDTRMFLLIMSGMMQMCSCGRFPAGDLPCRQIFQRCARGLSRGFLFYPGKERP